MIKKLKKERLLEQILRCEDMLQGSIVKINSRCGKKGCKCERGEYHGISYYLSYREGGRTQMVYIPKHLVAEVIQRIDDFKRYWDLGVKLAKVNLQQLKEKQKITHKKAR
ncbi:MAG: DUF6788 family protein [bacterium]